MRKNPFPVIALVDENRDEQQLLERGFEACRSDLQIQLLASGEELLDYLNQKGQYREQGSEPDLIIIAAHMWEKSVFQLIEDIKTSSSLKHIPLVALIDSLTDIESRWCYELGANTVIKMPAFFDEIVEVLKILCDYWFGPVRM